jgi:histidyl-tRNA synthetase
MSTLSKEAYRGCRDLFPPDKRLLNFMFQKMSQAAELFGYEPYDGPLLEPVELYLAKSGEELINDQIYAFYDRGERHVAIRPEMTPTLARMVAQVHREKAKPLRWYSIPNLMRYEKPQRGRLREHWQFNCDIFGGTKILAEMEILQIIIKLLTSFGATSEHFEILFNSRELVNAFFQKHLEVTSEQSHSLYKLMDKAKKISPETLSLEIAKILPDSSKQDSMKEYLSLKNFAQAKEFFARIHQSEAVQNCTTLLEHLAALKLDQYLVYDSTIVRGLDYYTGLVFEAFDKHPDNRRAICGGGVYANLLQIFNEPALEGVGFGLGDVTLADFLRVHDLLPNTQVSGCDLLIGYTEEKDEVAALTLAAQFREAGIKTEFYPGVCKPKKIFSFAESKAHPFVLLLGMERKLKHLQTQNTFTMDPNATSSVKEAIEFMRSHQ